MEYTGIFESWEKYLENNQKSAYMQKLSFKEDERLFMAGFKAGFDKREQKQHLINLSDSEKQLNITKIMDITELSKELIEQIRNGASESDVIQLLAENFQAEKLRENAVSRRFFSDLEDFNQFMINQKPKEIWLDEFMEDAPYIILSFNDGVKFRGVYNQQCLLAGDNSDFTWLYKIGMYVKTF